MGTTANQSGYGNPGVGGSPWGAGHGPGAPWGGYPGNYPGGAAWYWHSRYTTRPLWIVAMILGFMFWWPVGLAVLFFTLGSRRMSCWGYGRQDGYDAGWQGGAPPPWVAMKRQWKQQMKEWCRGQGQGQAQAQPAQPSSGNRAFDEYRAETLRRLEEEQKEFGAYLDRLRFAKDKAEFDQFMAELRQRPSASPQPSHGPSPQG
jgi:hypothetical protein